MQQDPLGALANVIKYESVGSVSVAIQLSEASRIALQWWMATQKPTLAYVMMHLMVSLSRH